MVFGVTAGICHNVGHHVRHENPTGAALNLHGGCDPLGATAGRADGREFVWRLFLPQ